MYRGFTLSLEHRSSRLTYGAYYTWSQNFTNDDNERGASGYEGPNQFDLSRDYNYSIIDARHQFTSYAVLSLPLDIELSGSFSARSGRPINPAAGTDANGDFQSYEDRPYQAPGVPFLRNSFRDQAVVDANNLRVLKVVPIGDRTKVELSAEFFNLFNLDNVVVDNSGNADETYGLGIDPATGNAIAPPDSFMRIKLPDGSYDTSNQQRGGPFQAQFGIRLLF